jgi:hypothetical protein
MKASSDTLQEVLAVGPFAFWYVADLWYDGQRRLQDIPLGDVQLNEDDSRAVKAQGSCNVYWTDDFGRSVMPVAPGDLFSPFGSELAIYAMVSIGTFTERIPMGWYQIVDVPTMRDSTMFWRRRELITTGTVLELRLQDRFIQIQNDRFDVPGSPSQLLSVYAEIAALTGLQITKSLPDTAITRSVAYQEDKMQAVLDLADLLGGVPYAAPDGTVAMRPKAWGAPVDTLRGGDRGALVTINKGMTADGVYNVVAFRGQGDKQDQVLSRSEVKYGPLRTKNADGTRSPAHRRPTYRSNQFVNTNQQAQAYTDSELARVSTLSAIQWPIEEVWNPLRELGDVLTVVDEHDDDFLVRVTAIDRSRGRTQKVTVARE